MTLALLVLGIVGCARPGEVARIDLDVRSLLLRGAGDVRQVDATTFDADGEVVEAEITWSSEDPGVVSVDDGGLEGVAMGSTTVIAQAGEAEASLFAWVAEPKDVAVLFTDDQVMSGPDFLPDQPNLVGARFEITLSGVSASPGDVLIPLEDTPAAGQVVANDGGTFEVEVVPLTELFDELSLRTSGRVVVDDARTVEFTVGPFECEADGDVVPEFDTDDLDTDLVPDLDYDLDVQISQGLLHYALVWMSGSVHAQASGTVAFPTTLSGQMTCEAELASPVIPVAGALSWFIAPQVPLGIGLELEGEAEVEVEVDVEGEVGAAVTVGFEYAPSTGVVPLTDYDFDHDIDAELDVASLTESLSAEASVYVFGFAKLEIGLTTSDDASITLVEVDAGLQQEADVAHPVVQLEDEEGSDYTLALHGEIAAGEDVDDFLDYIGLSDDLDLSADHDITLGRSPTGTFSYDPDEVTEAVEVTGTITLDEDDASYPIVGYNVAEVRIYGVEDDAEGVHLLDTLYPTGEQTEWEWTYLPDAVDVANGITSFAAFVVTTALPGVPLALDGDVPCSDGYTGDFLYVQTEADLDALAGTTRIGDVQIAGIAGVTDLSALAGLERACWLYVGSMPDLQSLAGLEDLEAVHKLSLVALPQLTDLSELTSLQTITGGRLEIQTGDALTSLAGIAGVSMETEAGYLAIGGAGVTTLAALSGVSGTLERLQISNTGLTSLSGLEGIDGLASLLVSANPDLTTLSVLSGASFAGLGQDCAPPCPYISVRDNDALSSLAGLENSGALKTVSIHGNPALVTTAALAVAGEMDQLTVYDNAALTSLEGFDGVSRVEELTVGLENNGNDSLTAVHLGGVTEVGNAVYRDNALLPATGLSNLQTARQVSLEGTSLQTTGMSSLELVTGDLYIGNNPDLTTLGMPSLVGICSAYTPNNPNVPAQEFSDLYDVVDPSHCVP